jgi:hypothetical protein
MESHGWDLRRPSPTPTDSLRTCSPLRDFEMGWQSFRGRRSRPSKVENEWMAVTHCPISAMRLAAVVQRVQVRHAGAGHCKSGFKGREWPVAATPRPTWRTAPGLVNGRRTAVLHGANAAVCSRLKADCSHPVRGHETGNILRSLQTRGCGEACESQGEALSINGEAGGSGRKQRRLGWMPRSRHSEPINSCRIKGRRS